MLFRSTNGPPGTINILLPDPDFEDAELHAVTLFLLPKGLKKMKFILERAIEPGVEEDDRSVATIM